MEIEGYDEFVEVGRGGFATVFRARELSTDRDVAVKVLSVELDDSNRRRFRREIEILARLSEHPNVVTLYGSGITASGRPYLVMPFLSKGSLADRLRDEGRLSSNEVERIESEIGAALRVAHEMGVVHADIKPQNVMVSDFGSVQLADFGIGRYVDTTASLTGLAMTPSYAAPEIISGVAANVETDIYGLGAMLYALCSGRAPYEKTGDESLLALLQRAATTRPTPLLQHEADEGLRRRIERMMDPDPAMRSWSMDPTANQSSVEEPTGLEQAAPGQGSSSLIAQSETTIVKAADTEPSERSYPPDESGKRLKRALIAIFALSVVIGGGALLIWRGEGLGSAPTDASLDDVAEEVEEEPLAVPAVEWAAAPAVVAGLNIAGVSFASDVDSSYTFDWEGSDGSSGSEAGGPATDHNFEISGLTPGTDYNWTVTVTDENDHTLTESGSFTTEAPELTPSAVTINVGDEVVLEGTVPDEDTKGALGSAAVAQYGDAAVTNNLVVDEGYTNDGGTIAVIGAVGTDAAKDAAGEAFEGIGGLGVSNDVDVSGDMLVAALNELFQLEPIQFDSGSANIRAESIGTLAAAAELLLANISVNLTIEAHTDDQGPDDFNLELSDARANSVFNYFTANGIDQSRLTAIGKGESDPIADNATDEGRRQNRRIEFKLDDT